MQQTNILSVASKVVIAFMLLMSISACQSGQKKADKQAGI